MRRRVRPHRDAAPRTFGTFRREVTALLVAKGMSWEQATRTALRWNDYIKARWSTGKPPCAVSDHLMRWSKEKVVCPCKRGGDPSPTCKVHGRRRVRRDADNPKAGEVYEAKTSGRRWEVVSVEGDRITMKPVGVRSEGQLVFSKSSLKGMRVLKGAIKSFVDRILGGEEEDVNPVALEAAARRGSDPGGRRRRLTRKRRKTRGT